MLKNILTNRLELVPVTLVIIQSLSEGSNEELKKIGIKPNAQWPTEDTKDILPIIYESLVKSKIPSGFEFWMIVNRDTMQVIGDIGFHGKPNDQGIVEVGFGLVEKERGKGFGFEALEAIMDWLSDQESVKVIKADCLINNIPSQRILQKVHMKEINRDQDFIYWEFVK